MKTTADATKPAATLFFDATCSLCAGAARRWLALLKRHDIAVLPLQGEDARRALDLDGDVIPEEMKLLRGEHLFGGADAIVEVARRIWWARPLAWLGSWPPARALLRLAYARLAKRRHCFRKDL